MKNQSDIFIDTQKILKENILYRIDKKLVLMHEI
jgi:hypothetical protein